MDVGASLTLGVYWTSGPMVGGDYIRWVGSYMKILAELDELFSPLYIVPNASEKGVGILSEGVDFDAAIISGLNHDIAYVGPDGKSSDFTVQSTSKLGFYSLLSTTPISDASTVTISVDAGAGLPNSTSRLVIDIPAGVLSADKITQLFKLTVQFIKPRWARVWDKALQAHPRQPVGNISIGWLTYFSDKSISELLPGDVKVQVLDDGLIVQAADVPPTLNDQTCVNAILRIFNALEPSGVLKKKA